MTTSTLATALEREHREIDAGVEAFLAGLAEGQPRPESLIQAMRALRRHIYLEEQFLFPPLREAGMVAPIFVMLREHGEIWDTMDAMDRELARDGAGAAMSEVCRVLLEQLERHNAKEEPIIYPQADAVLAADASAELHEHLAAGRLPEGWVCARAGA
jgi:hemerythrin-like domain-containing protein